MINEVHEMTRIKRPLYSTVATWVKQSWEDIDVELIKTSFKCCGISLAGDDQESNWLFNTDQLYHGQDIEITNLNDVETNSEDNVKCEYNNDWGCALIVISHMIPRGYVIIGVSVPGSLTKPLPYMVGGTLHRGVL